MRLLQVNDRSAENYVGMTTHRRRVTSVSSRDDATIADLATALIATLGSFANVRVANVDLDWPSAWIRVSRSSDGSRYYEEISLTSKRGWKHVRIPPGMVKSLSLHAVPLSKKDAKNLPKLTCDVHGPMTPFSISGRAVKYRCEDDHHHTRLITIP